MVDNVSSRDVFHPWEDGSWKRHVISECGFEDSDIKRREIIVDQGLIEKVRGVVVLVT
jgi:hypothetical protein